MSMQVTEICALTGANHVCCADQAGVVRTNNVAKLYGVFWVGNGKPNEAVLPVPRRPVESRGEAFQVVGVMTW